MLPIPVTLLVSRYPSIFSKLNISANKDDENHGAFTPVSSFIFITLYLFIELGKLKDSPSVPAPTINKPVFSSSVNGQVPQVPSIKLSSDKASMVFISNVSSIKLSSDDSSGKSVINGSSVSPNFSSSIKFS